MKILSILLVSFLVCLTTSGRPGFNNFIKSVNDKTLPDISRDKDFVKSVDEILSLQARGIETISTESLNNSFNKIGISILVLKNKYAELNDQSSASLIINAAINKLAQQDRIAKLKNNYSTRDFVCLRQLYAALVICVRTSANHTALFECVRGAYSQFVVCVQANH